MTVEPEQPAPLEARSLRERSRIEVIPLPSLRKRLDAIPAGARLSVTCSPSEGVDASVEMTARLRDAGHDAIPHLSAGTVTSREQLAGIVRRCDRMGVNEVFFIGGDVRQGGPFQNAHELATAYAAASSALRVLGFAGYPEGHPTINEHTLVTALHQKQELVHSAGLDGYVSTQMCFDGRAVSKWVADRRARGLTLPVRFGVPGQVDRLKLMTISGRLGIGNSLKFLRKNRSSVTKLMSSPTFRPDDLVAEVLGASVADPTATVDGLHLFSFNNLAPTFTWFGAFTSAH
ncbi:methylenetetrahydrofolate reductase [Sciscionella marina]|uniref:methylenetetrahydrofolate reductase n=1 Tax=Sciscionella marina TaxID=508770 RepID=UPI000380FE22|nr:methylenetetrahydrofolate reductase [Sciscionella marina]